MSEEDVRGGLLDAVAEEPPLVFDPDDIVAAGRRQTRRRALVAAGFTTVLIAVAAVAVPVALGRGTSTTPAAEQPGTTVSAPVELTVDQLRQRAEAMSAHLRDTLPTTLPAASDFTYGEFGGEANGEFFPGQTSINAAISFTVDGGRYSIMVNSFAPGGMTRSPAEVCVLQCQELGQKANGEVYAQTEKYGEGIITTVFHYRDTGAVVMINAYSYDVTATVKPTYLPAVALTLDQQIAIATDPELEL